MTTYDDYIKSKTYEVQMSKMYGDNPIHNQHIDEFRQMALLMIDNALKEHDEKLQLDIQTTLNGRSVSMPGLISDMKNQIMTALRKAFR